MLEYSNYILPIFYANPDMASPLDLSTRNSGPITPPTTPSPQRKKCRVIDEIDLTKDFLKEPWLCKLRYFDGCNESRSIQSAFKWPEKIIKSSENDQVKCSIEPDNKNINSKNWPLMNCDANLFDYRQCDKKLSELKDGQLSNGFITDEHESDDEDGFVDILSQDDENLEPSEPQKYLLLPEEGSCDEKNGSDVEETVKNPGVLEKNATVYEDKNFHEQAVNGFAELFNKGLVGYNVDVPKIDTIQSLAVPQNPEKSEKSNSENVVRVEKKKTKFRKQHLDEDNSSPVSGTIIRKLGKDEELVVRKGDIDPAFNVVEITDEAKAIIAQIDNKIGSYICQLCKKLYDDAFKLAQHRCSRIVHIEYKCAECEKVKF